jgi:hypothetical protein
LVIPEPKKRPKSSFIRFEAAMPNGTWQSDSIHYRLTHPDGTAGEDTENHQLVTQLATFASGSAM